MPCGFVGTHAREVDMPLNLCFGIAFSFIPACRAGSFLRVGRASFWRITVTRFWFSPNSGFISCEISFRKNSENKIVHRNCIQNPSTTSQWGKLFEYTCVTKLLRHLPRWDKERYRSRACSYLSSHQQTWCPKAHCGIAIVIYDFSRSKCNTLQIWRRVGMWQMWWIQDSQLLKEFSVSTKPSLKEISKTIDRKKSEGKDLSTTLFSSSSFTEFSLKNYSYCFTLFHSTLNK